MKLTVHEAFILAREKLPTNLNYELVFFGDELLNAKAVVAFASKEKASGLNALSLVHLGMARNFDEAKKLIEKAQKAVDIKSKL
jgi:hypothetical protein